MSTAFHINDRVRVSSNAPALKNLAGRDGTIVEILSGNELYGPNMFAVKIDNLYSVPVVPFYEHELILLMEKVS